MGDYIQNCNNKVYILDANACLYMIPIDRYNKDYDMFNLGNFGSRGEKGKIEDLQNENDITILIRNDNIGRNWQNPEQVREYIKNNLNKIGTIEIFDIYVKE